jgi:hypothetical protein
MFHPRDQSLHILIEFLGIVERLGELFFLLVRLFYSGRPV